MNIIKTSSRTVVQAINRLDVQLGTQSERASLLQRYLDEHSRRLHELFARLDASSARLEALLDVGGH